MKDKKILILGGSRYYSRCIEGLKDSGYFVIVADRDRNADGFSFSDAYEICDIVDEKAILRIAMKYRIDAIVPINDYGVPTASYVSSKLRISGISLETAKLSTNKEAMRKCWSESGIPCPKFKIATCTNDIRKVINEIGFPCILKPAHGIGGASRGIVVVRNSSEIKESIKFSTEFYTDKTTIVEEFVTAESEHSVEVLIDHGKPHIIAVSDKVKSDLPYRVDKAVIYPSALSGEQLDNMQKIVVDSVLALGVNNGVAHVELGLTDRGFVLFELGARCGGGGTANPIVKEVYGVDLFGLYVKVLLGEEIKPFQSIPQLGCCYYFLTPKSGIVKSISGFEFVKNDPTVLDTELHLTKGSKISKVTVGTQRSGFIIKTAKTAKSALKQAEKLEKAIKISYLQT